jgi:hypothetical protein
MTYADYLQVKGRDMATSAKQFLDAISQVSVSRSLGLVGFGFVILAGVKIISLLFLTKNSSNFSNLTKPQVRSTEHHKASHQNPRNVSESKFDVCVLCHSLRG